MPSNLVLVVGGTPELVNVVTGRLEGGHSVEWLSSSAQCAQRFSDNGADLIVAFLPLPDGGGAELLKSVLGTDPRASVVVTGRDSSIRGAGDAFQAGAFEYVEDPVADIDGLVAAAGVALGSRRGDLQLRWIKQRDSVTWESIVGTSAEMQEVVGVLKLLCERTLRGSPPTVLISGETGTGKGLLARAIHYNGTRRNQAFVAQNCAAIPGNLLESELFGYERGAFTDAKTSRAGLFEMAQDGTLVLDEIGSIPIELQAKLLTAIEEKRIRRLGGRQDIELNVQIVAATHDDLKSKVLSGGMREDLYHRLNVVSVVVPPLRRRGNDRLVLARNFLFETCREYGIQQRRFSEDAERYIVEYRWPGNVRELKNQIERIVLLGSGEFITRIQFEPPAAPPPSTRPGPNPNQSGTFSITLPDDGLALEDVERYILGRALDRFDGNVSAAARYLKISRQTMIYRIKKHGLG